MQGYQKLLLFWEGIWESEAIIRHCPTSLPSCVRSGKSPNPVFLLAPPLERKPRALAGPKGNGHAPFTALKIQTSTSPPPFHDFLSEDTQKTLQPLSLPLTLLSFLPSLSHFFLFQLLFSFFSRCLWKNKSHNSINTFPVLNISNSEAPPILFSPPTPAKGL